MLKVLLRTVSVLLIVLLFTTSAFAGSNGKPLKSSYVYSANSNKIDFTNKMEYPYYSDIEKQYEKSGYRPAANQSVLIDCKDIILPQGKTVQANDVDGKSAFVWKSENNNIKWNFQIAKEGLYEVYMNYYLVSSTGNAAKRSISIDDKVPFYEADGIQFYRAWRDEGTPLKNNVGDEVKPRQSEIKKWQRMPLEDGHGFYAEPFSFYFSKGSHSVTMKYINEDMAIGTLEIMGTSEIPQYSAVKEQYSKSGYKKVADNISVEFQAEDAIEKNDSTLRRESDTDPATVPSSPTERKLNIIGNIPWSKGNQSITWSFKAPVDGLYSMSLRFGQIWLNGLPSYRRIMIDGKVPFKELLHYKFDYRSGWQSQTLSNNEEPYEFYLEKGTHTITMTVKLGPMTQILQSINEDSINLSNIMLEILRLTGGNPDPNYDYDFFANIPGLKENLMKFSSSLRQKYQYLVDLCEGRIPGFANSILATKKKVDEMVKDPFSIAKNVGNLTNIQSSLGEWYLDFQTQPLMIDYFVAQSSRMKFHAKEASFLDKLYYVFMSLIISFQKDYDKVESIADGKKVIKDSIDVWIARGTEWATLIKELADDQFTPKTGIRVNINIMPSSQLNAGSVNALMLSLTSGKAPDIAMGVDPGSPVEFAIRDAVCDLSKMKDFNDISNRFIKECLVPFKYNKGVYALPETMDFRVLIYRKDIVQKLGISLPDTRVELYENVLPVLYQNGMNFFYPRDDSQFIFQNAAQYYSEDGLRSALDSPEAFLALKEETELYTNYGIPVSASFYNRFRSGETPMGIGSFSDYIQILTAAPELGGRWGIAPLPGKKKADGSIDRSVGSITGQCSIILKQSKKSEQSWQFLKWWSDSQTQLDFGREIEALVGTQARWNSANIVAFKSMPWDSGDMDVIEKMWPFYKEIPVVLGGYFTGRYLTNAWNNTVISGYSLRDSLEDAVREINRELRMKQQEYNVK